jgi:hypothetical protein
MLAADIPFIFDAGTALLITAVLVCLILALHFD